MRGGFLYPWRVHGESASERRVQCTGQRTHGDEAPAAPMAILRSVDRGARRGPMGSSANGLWRLPGRVFAPVFRLHSAPVRSLRALAIAIKPRTPGRDTPMRRLLVLGGAVIASRFWCVCWSKCDYLSPKETNMRWQFAAI